MRTDLQISIKYYQAVCLDFSRSKAWTLSSRLEVVEPGRFYSRCRPCVHGGVDAVAPSADWDIIQAIHVFVGPFRRRDGKRLRVHKGGCRRRVRRAIAIAVIQLHANAGDFCFDPTAAARSDPEQLVACREAFFILAFPEICFHSP